MSVVKRLFHFLYGKVLIFYFFLVKYALDKYLWYCQLHQKHPTFSKTFRFTSCSLHFTMVMKLKKKKAGMIWYVNDGQMCVFLTVYACVYTCLFLWLLWAGGGWFIPNCAAGRHIIAKWGEEGLMGKGLGRRGWGSEGQRKNVGEVTVHHDNWTNCWRTDLYLKILLGWGT